MKEPINIIIAGVGGQGNIVASEIMAQAAVSAGFNVTVGETYGAAQRGGSVMSHVRLSKQHQYGPLIPKGQADVVLGFEPLESLRVLLDYGNERVKLVVNPRPNYPVSVLVGESRYPHTEQLFQTLRSLCAELRLVEGTELAKQAGNHLAQNLAMLGALAGTGWVPIPQPVYEKAIRGIFSGEALDLNLRAFRLGVEAVGCVRGL